MATRFAEPQPLPLDMLLATIPSLPRPILAALTARMIDHMDALDPDPDLEPDDEDESVEDHPLEFDPESDYGPEELGECDGIGPDMRPIADQQAYRDHFRRIRRERCWSRPTRWGTREFHLWLEPDVPTKRNILRRKRGMPRSPRA
jgi:hypothetical protein